MLSSRFFSRIFLILSFALIATSATRGQDDYLTRVGVPAFTTAIPVEHGFMNLATGDLHMEIPLGSFPQRGGQSYDVRIIYDSGIWTPSSGAWSPNNVALGYGGRGGWRLITSGLPGFVAYDDKPAGMCNADGKTTNNSFKNFSWTAPDGTVHNFRTLTPWTVTVRYTTACGTGSWGGVPHDAVSDDALGYHIFVTAGCLQPFCKPNVTVYAPNGTRANGGTVRDSNGNFYNDLGAQGIDTLSRAVVNTTGSGSLFYHDVLNSQGATSRYTVQTEQVSVHTAFGTTNLEYSGTLTVIQSITLPDGASYSFTYDAGTTSGHYGLLTSMTLPTGAVINYGSANFTDANSRVARWITSRSTSDGTWSYIPQVIPPCNSFSCQQVTVTKPSGDSAIYTFLIFLNGHGTWPMTVQHYNGSPSPSNLLATLNQCWSFSTFTSGVCSAPTNSSPIYVHKIASTTTVPLPGGTNLSETTQLAWDSTNYGNLVQRSEWNFYSGSLPAVADRTVSYTYLNAPAYLTANIVNRPTAITVTDKNGNTVSQTLYAYDGSSLTTVSGVTNHDDANYGASNTVRGNLTQVQQLVSGTSNFVTTSKTYDTTGQVTTSTDGNGIVTMYSYADNFFNDNGDTSNPIPYSPPAPTNAYLKTITRGGLTNIFGHYWGTGQKALSTDPNNQTTYFHYFDSLSRPTSTKMPDSGWTFIQYNSTETQIDTGIGITSTALTTNCPISSSACRHDQTLLDGLGRVTSLILVSDPAGATTTASAYDSNGRVLKTSNPYRSTSDATYGWTTITYDGLNRTIQVQRQDGSLFRTFYGAQVGAGGGTTSQLCSSSSYGLGYPVLTVDEAGKKRQTWTDGFGRMMEVDEPDSTGSLTVATCYKYDLNNNLIVVLQNGSRQRAFTYNLLSQLLTSADPESGTTTYTYDNNSNLQTKVAPAPNQTGSATVTTTFTYDQLNRLTQKSFSDGTTPTVKYGYDAVAPSGCTPPILTITNGIGRRTSMCDGAGAEAWSYDGMGRPLADGRISNVVTKTTTYTYNLDGSIATLTYPSGRVITYTPNAAGRAISAVDSTGPINYATAAAYAPIGALFSFTNGASIISTYFYNNRLQPCRISVKNTGSAPASCMDAATGNVLDFRYDFSLGSSDNGNVTTITNNRDTTRSQLFSYDQVNRISTAKTTSTTGTTCWDEAFGYDPWGNLLSIGRITGYTCSNEELLSVSATTNNQISGDTYDAAGNLMTIPTIASYSYDAENHLKTAAGVTYTYDGDGRRIQKSSGKLYWYGMGSDPLNETDLAGNTNNSSFNEYIFFGGKRIARRDSSNNVNYYFADHLGTARVVADSSGTVLDDSDFYPFGGERVITSSSGNTYKFTGKERDSESGLDDFGARYASSSMGRFMTPDPVGGHQEDPQTLNKYNYVRNNPLNLTDPTGLDFNLKCKETKANVATCQNGIQGTTKTDANGKSTFTPTVIRNKNGDLVDQNGNYYNATVSGQGVSFSQDGSNQPASLGVFINGSDPTTVQGNGDLTGFSFTFTYSNMASNVTAGGYFNFTGTADQAEAALDRAGYNSWISHLGDLFDRYHPSGLDFDAVDYRSPGGVGGANSGHFTVHEPVIQIDRWRIPVRATVPASGEVHLGEHNPYTSLAGALAHFREVRDNPN